MNNPPKGHFDQAIGNTNNYDEVVLVTNLYIQNDQQHYLHPFSGMAHIAYIPRNCTVSYSKLVNFLDDYRKCLLSQEALTMNIASELEKLLHPNGVAVILRCQHSCTGHRAINMSNPWVTTSKLTGAFLKKTNSRQELLQMIKTGSIAHQRKS